MQLYSYWRSQASYRVRIALAFKGLSADITTLDLIKGDQQNAKYRSLNPEMVVPTLVDDGGRPLFQSLAILEFLEEKYPDPPLLPKDLHDRAYARGLAHIVAMDAHPFIVPRVRKYLEQELKLDEPTRIKWLRHWMDAGTRSVEDMIAKDSRTGRFCIGSSPTFADICVFAHVTSAKMLYGFDSTVYPTVHRIVEACANLPQFAATHPLKQPDAGQKH